MKSKTIVQIIPQLSSGGAERFVVDLSNELCLEYNVILITFFPLDTHGFYLSEIKREVTVISMNKRLGKDWFLPFKLYRIIRKIRPSVIHMHLNAFFYSIVSIILSSGNWKLVHTIHNDALVEGPGKKGIFIKKSLLKIRKIDFVSISKDSLLSFEKYYNRKGILIENGRKKPEITDQEVNLEIQAYKITPYSKIFVNIARIAPQKNHIMLVEAFEQLINENYDVVLLMIGYVRDVNILNFIKAHSNKRIVFLGERKEAVQFLGYSDAFCLSSLNEGMPISLIESFAVGCLPICTPAGGISNMIINGKNGILSEDFSCKSFKEAIKSYLLLSQVEIEKIKNECKISFEKYTIDNCAKNYIDLYFKN